MFNITDPEATGITPGMPASGKFLTIPRYLYDWIVPGEIIYCRHGWHLIAPTGACMACPPNPALAMTKPCYQLNNALVAKVVEIAKQRRAAGLPPRYWLK